jgi:hypothetical protein
LEDEVLIYDTVSDKAYCLNETLAKVFNACDDKQTFDDLKRSYQFTDDLIFLALDKLKNKNLLADDDSYQLPFAGMSRREAVRRVGFGTRIAPNSAGCFDSGANTTVCGSGYHRTLLRSSLCAVCSELL